MVGLLLLSCRSRFERPIDVESYVFKQPITLTMTVNDANLLRVASTLAIAEIQRLGEALDPLNNTGKLYHLNTTHKSTDPELYGLLQQAELISEFTHGGLNLFVGYLEQAYGFDRMAPRPPSPSTIREILLSMKRARIDFIPERTQVNIYNDAYSITLSGIQEGYVVDQALAHLALAGVHTARVTLGKQMACAASPDGLGWEYTIRDPGDGSTVRELYLENCGAATASILDKAYTYRDNSYFIHLDPKNGQPADSMASVTVVSPSAEMSNALARGIFIMGPQSGLALLNRMSRVEGLIIPREGNVLISDSLYQWMGN
ncbi:MAG: FAD:protein FMN transferase [Candidatus Marinimicrobia bacterium]|nr:FAD:protein FMN transferase [Candidatus Neomarinimicrobiota bacterium]